MESEHCACATNGRELRSTVTAVPVVGLFGVVFVFSLVCVALVWVVFVCSECGFSECLGFVCCEGFLFVLLEITVNSVNSYRDAPEGSLVGFPPQ